MLVRKRRGCSGFTPTHWAFKNPLSGGVRTEEGNVLFNDALNTFYLQLYTVGHMVKDQSHSERGNPLEHWLE